MRQIILFSFLLLSLGSFSQKVAIPANSKADVSLILLDLQRNKGRLSEEIKDRFAFHKVEGIDYVSFLAKVASSFNANELNDFGIITNRPVNGIISLKIPIDQLGNLESLPGIVILQLAGKIKADLDKAVKDTRADSVQYGINLPQSYTGRDVLIGITDWGFDYSSPMFYDTLLQETRILAAWDQFKTSGPAPTGFTYGTEYSDPTSLINAGADTANIYSYATHGTHVAGIAGGSGAGTIYRGFAFDAQFLFTTFLVDEGAVLDAWQWMYDRSVAESKRLVINMSWGLYHLGTLDGNSLLSQAIDAYAALGVVFANSGGNNGNVNFHIKKDFSNDELITKIDFYSYSANANMWGQSIHMWGEVGKEFEAGLKIYNSTGSTMVESPYFSTDLVTEYIDTFLVLGLDTVWYNISADASHPLNDRPQMRLRVKNTNTQLRVILKSNAVDGRVHYWNVTELSNDVGNWGMPFSVYGAGSVSGDNLYGISEPSCSNGVISVAAYASSWLTPGGSQTGGGIASFSSYGPRYDEVLKPDISAPGSAVGSSISSYTDNNFTQVASVDFGGRTYPFAKFSGTSMASPAVAGICALILEANPYLSAAQVKYIIKVSARQDTYTGVIPAEGSTRWGWGKINAYHAVQLALGTVGLMENTFTVSFTVFPNPAESSLQIASNEALPEKAQIIDLNGKVTEVLVQNKSIDISGLNSGKYVLRIESKGRIEQVSFIKL
jgi:minor extracellular serine protease Vpr